MGLDIPSSSDWAIRCKTTASFVWPLDTGMAELILRLVIRISIQVNDGSVADGEALGEL